MTDINHVLIGLVKSAVITGREPDGDLFSGTDINSLLALAKKHYVLPPVCCSLLKYSGQSDEDFKKRMLAKTGSAVKRYYDLENELKTVGDVFSKAGIRYIPLKGAVMRGYYSEPWMRTSCDTDILIHEEDLEQAQHLLETELGYRFAPINSHDVSAFSPSGTHLELHYRLSDSEKAAAENDPARSVWEYSQPSAPGSCCWKMQDEMFYYYHICHMAKHFKHGGCGIRPLIDLAVLRKTGLRDIREKAEPLLSRGGLSQFAALMERLTDIWFYEGQHDDTTKTVEAYLLKGGIYGNTENRVSVQQAKKGNRRKYLLSRIWLPARSLKYRYPSLEKHKYLLPVYEVRRWFSDVFSKRLSRGIRELSASKSVSGEQQADTEKMLSDLGLL